jgi:hypothetical protein
MMNQEEKELGDNFFFLGRPRNNQVLGDY